MKPPYSLTPNILAKITTISEKLGAIDALFLTKPSPLLRKKNQIKTIHGSLKIEGNTLSESQITAILENKRVVGPPKDIQEVLNAIQVYETLAIYDPTSKKSFLAAHRQLMEGLIPKPGQYRTENVGIVQGNQVSHLAPPAKNVHFLMKNLFSYLAIKEELTLIKSCVFHYEMEFIHPFLDGNGRMGRLWQTLILMQEYPVFEHLPFESLVQKTQREYYQALSKSDKAGNSTLFIEYMLGVIDQSLSHLLQENTDPLTPIDRIHYFSSLNKSPFSRKEYLNVFKNISSATGSRDLKKGVELGFWKIQGDKRNALYFKLK